MANKNLFYSWLGELIEQPELVKECIKSWSIHLSDFKVTNMNRDYIKDNNIQSKYLDKVIELDLRAHVSDYLRFHSMFTYGGLYLDSDVMCYGDISDILVMDYYLGREGSRSSVPDNFEAAILYFKEPNNPKLKELLDAYDNLPLEEMTYKEIKLLTSPMMMRGMKFESTSESHNNLEHKFNNSWFDYDILFMDGGGR